MTPRLGYLKELFASCSILNLSFRKKLIGTNVHPPCWIDEWQNWPITGRPASFKQVRLWLIKNTMGRPVIQQCCGARSAGSQKSWKSKLASNVYRPKATFGSTIKGTNWFHSYFTHGLPPSLPATSCSYSFDLENLVENDFAPIGLKTYFRSCWIFWIAHHTTTQESLNDLYIRLRSPCS